MIGSRRSRCRARSAAGVALAWGMAAFLANLSVASPSAPGVEPPAPGTYRLERIMDAPDGVVLDASGRSQKLSRWTRDRVTLLSFVYTSCSDPQGCPLAYSVFAALARRVENDARLAGRVRFVTLSFDPAHDVPEVMRQYGGDQARQDRSLEWHFFTTRSAADLRPLLEGFGQDLQVVARSADEGSTRELSHVLKVFLIDPSGTIREIYSSAYLRIPVVFNDILTLVLEDAAAVAKTE